MIKQTLKTATITLCLPLALAACGGGDDTAPCSSATTLAVGFVYSSVGISAPGSSFVSYKPGEAFSNTPAVQGVPASCDAVKRFTVKAQPSFSAGPAVNLPSSVTLDPVTGTFAGTLAVPLGKCGSGGFTTLNTTNPACSGDGTFEKASFDVTLTLPGYTPLTKSVTFTTPI